MRQPAAGPRSFLLALLSLLLVAPLGAAQNAATQFVQTDRYGIDVGTMERDPETYLIDPDRAGSARPFRVADRDFNIQSLRGNAVLRWEFRPGSTLFLVWQQNRFDQLYRLTIDPAYARVGSFDLVRDARELFGIRPHNVLLIKATYWLNP